MKVFASVLFAIIAVGGVRPASAAPAATATFEGVGDLPGDILFTSMAKGLSADGSVVVGRSSGGNNYEPFRWKDGTMTALGSITGEYYQGAGHDASSDGSIVVGQAFGGTGNYEAFRWENGVMTGLGFPPGGSPVQSFAKGVSADGSVIVGGAGTANGVEATVWQAGNITPLGDLAGGSFDSTANGVSADGAIIVGYGSGAAGMEAFRWEDGTMTGLGDLPGGSAMSSAWSISADGSVVVGYSSGANGIEAFRWQAGVMQGLGDLPGGAFMSFARDTSADGSIVVGYGTNAEDRVAMIWTAADGMRDLKQVLETEYGLDLTGWKLGDAQAISDDGLVIAGDGVNPSGNNEGWRVVLSTGEGGGNDCTGNQLLCEDFEQGIPGSWTIFGNENSTAASAWGALDHGTLGHIAKSNFNDSVPAGEFAEDFLVTPLLTLSDQAYVQFDAAEQLGSDNGSEYEVLVSTTVAGDPTAFTTIAAYTEADFPVPSAGAATFTIDLSAYAGQSIYIAFLHRQNNGDFFYLDNVEVVTAPAGECLGGEILCEDFEQGIPGDWAIFANEFTNTASTWAALNHGTLGHIARSNFNDEVPAGEFAEDYLATPLLSLGVGASLQFDAAEQLGSDNGSQYEVLVSTTVADDPAAYTTVASYTEADFPVPSAGAATFTVDLAAYAGQSIYIAFLHRQNNGDFFYLDNVMVSGGEPLPPPTLAKTFAPETVEVGESSIATITLANPGPAAATLTADLVDTFPAGLDVQSFHTNCGLIVEPPLANLGGGGTSVGLQAGTVLQANGSCDIVVEVSSAIAGSYTNTLAAGALQTTVGSNAEAASATLTVIEMPTPPLATVTPTSLDFTVAADAIESQLLNIANAAGRDPLSFWVSAHSAAGNRFALQLSDVEAKQAQIFSATHPPASLAAAGMGASKLPAPWNPVASTRGEPLAFFHDDGSYENMVSWGRNGPSPAESMAVWINRFAPPQGTGPYTIDTISILWPGLESNALLGLQANLLVYYDADADGDPSNAVRLGADALVPIAELDVFQDYQVSFAVPGDGDVYIGFADQWAASGEYMPRLRPAAIDQTASQGMSYVSADTVDPADITNLANNDTNGTIDAAGVPGNWLIRAVASVGGAGGTCAGPVIDWLTVDPVDGTLNGGASLDINVTVDPAAGALVTGSYQGELCITTNDPTQNLIVVPVSLTVTTPDAIFCSGFETGEDGSCGAGGGEGNIVDSGVIDLVVPAALDGLSIDWLTGCSSEEYPSDCSNGSDWNPYHNSSSLTYFWPTDHGGLCASTDGNICDDLEPGDAIGPATSFADGVPSDAVLAGGTFYIGFSFTNVDTGIVNYGYARITSTNGDGFPFTINQYWYDDTGAAITIP